MQTSKISVVLCALMACAPLTLRATDTPAQAAARAQVVEKLKELEAQDAATNPTAPAATVVAPAIATPAPAAAITNEPVLKPIHQTKAEKNAAKLKAKQAADKAAADLKAQKQAAQIAADKAEADHAAAKKMAAAKAKTDKQAAELKARQDAVTAKATPKPTVVPVADAGKDIGLKPVAAPALPIAADKASSFCLPVGVHFNTRKCRYKRSSLYRY